MVWLRSTSNQGTSGNYTPSASSRYCCCWFLTSPIFLPVGGPSVFVFDEVDLFNVCMFGVGGWSGWRGEEEGEEEGTDNPFKEKQSKFLHF